MANARRTHIVAAYTIIGMGVGSLSIIFGFLGLIARSIERLGGGGLWLVLGGASLILSSVIIGSIVQIIGNSIATIKRLK